MSASTQPNFDNLCVQTLSKAENLYVYQIDENTYPVKKLEDSYRQAAVITRATLQLLTHYRQK